MLAALVSLPLSLSGLWVDGARATDPGHDSTVDFALNLDGTSAQNAVTNSAVLPTSGEFVLEAWIFDEKTNTGGTGRIISQGNTTANLGGFDIMTVNSAVANHREINLFYKCASSCGNTISTGVRFQTNSWQHIALVTNGASFDLYLNGQLAHTATNVGGSSMASSPRFVLGRPWLPEVASSEFKGKIDEVNVWTKPGTITTTAGFETWIQGHMHNYTPANALGLLARFDFNEGSGTTVFDRTTGNKDLTLNGTPTFSDVKTVSVAAKTVVRFPRSYLTPGGGWQVPAGVTRADLLVVGGGGGGGSRHAGGGGAGALLYQEAVSISGNLKVQVGQGGKGNVGITNHNGQLAGGLGQSSFLGTTELKGGGGGAGAAGAAQAGGSGGGMSGATPDPPAQASGTGLFNRGGSGAGNAPGNYAGGGGGGAQSAGANALVNVGGAGGSGYVTNISGSLECYAAGGGGGAETSDTAGAAGPCTSGQVTATITSRAGAGSIGSAAASSAAPNSGSGGGGGGFQTSPGLSGESGFGGSGIVMVAYAPTDDKFLDFSSTTVNLGNSGAGVPLTGSFTVEVWARADANEARNNIFSQRTGPSLGEFNLQTHNGRVLAGVRTGNNPIFDTGFDMPLNQWVHLSAVVDVGANTVVRFYVNGSLRSTSSGITNVTLTPKFRIGRIYEDHGGTESWKGDLDQVKVWNGALNEAEIASSMHAHHAVSVGAGKSLRAHWDFNDSNAPGQELTGTYPLTASATPVLSDLVTPSVANGIRTYKFDRTYLNAWAGWVAPTGTASRYSAAVVGGGGGGGAWVGGGGGAGGLIQSGTTTLNEVVIPVVVGQGGVGAVSSGANTLSSGATTGQVSRLGNVSALGGGRGGSHTGNGCSGVGGPPTSGGSGGGGTGSEDGSVCATERVGAAGTPGQGTKGGDGANSAWVAGGGGGASTAGSDSNGTNPGAGGNGLAVSITGSQLVLAGGGGGASHGNTSLRAAGGLGGGGIGGGITGAAGEQNTGGGGGGAAAVGNVATRGGSGGSGVVLLAFQIAPDAPTSLIATSGASVGLSWTPPVYLGEGSITDYVVQYRVSSSGTWTTFSDGVSASTSTSVTGLDICRRYDFQVSAANSFGQGVFSTAASAIVGAGTFSSVAGVTPSTTATRCVLNFTQVGATTWTPPSGTTSADVLAVGGGAGGWNDGGGGGGGGSGQHQTGVSLPNSAVTLTVGAGGSGGRHQVSEPTAGADSVATIGSTTIRAKGGSIGGAWTVWTGGAAGVSGTGGTYLAGGAGGRGPTEQDINNAAGSSTNVIGADGPGKTGLASPIIGSTLSRYGGGGGGGASSYSLTTSSVEVPRAAGGAGGGGAGAGVSTLGGIFKCTAVPAAPRGASVGSPGVPGSGGGGGGGIASGDPCDIVALDGDDGERTDGGAGGSGAIVVSFAAFGPPKVNVNFDELDFDFSRVVHIVGTNGRSQGNKVLYLNVFTRDGVQVDALVTTELLSGATIQRYESDAQAGGANSYFQADIDFSAANAFAQFKFEFYQHGVAGAAGNPCSVANPSCAGATKVALQNVNVSAIDIDFNQWNDFTQAESYTLAGNTKLRECVIPGSGTCTTRSTPATFPANMRFQGSGDFSRTNDPVDMAIVTYAQIETFTIKFGRSASGSPNYFGVAFKALDWGSTTPQTQGGAAQYTITYDGNGATSGAQAGTHTGAAGSTFTVLGAGTFVKTGHTFAGWSTSSSDTVAKHPANSKILLPGSNTVLYAIWTANKYTLTYSSNTGSGAPVATSHEAGTNNVTLSATVPTKTGFVFAGWNTLANGTGTNYSSSDLFSMPTSNTTLFAKWNVAPGTLQYNGNGGSTAEASVTAPGNSTTTVTRNSATTIRSGYDFAGWNTLANGSGSSFAVGSAFTLQANVTTTLFAQWTLSRYEVTFNLNGGSGTPQTNAYQPSQSVALPVSNPTRTGYTFAGWNTLANGNGTNYTSSFSMPSNDLVLFAKWTAITYSVTYNNNSSTYSGATGAVSDSSSPYSLAQTVSVKTGAALSNVTGSTTYRFVGWNTQADGSGTDYSPGNTFSMPSANLVLYAMWVDASVEISYSANGGTGAPANDNSTFGTTYNVSSPLPIRSGFTFLGWQRSGTTDVNRYRNAVSPTGFLITSNELLIADWSPINYKVTYNSDGGSTPPTEVVNRNINDVIVVDATAPTKSGFTFLGWKDAAGNIYSPGGTFHMGAGNVTLTAQWQGTPFTLTYQANGGVLPVVGGISQPAPEIRNNQAIANLASAVPTRVGYTFAGWNTLVGGTGTNYNSSASFTMPAENTTLYAKWTLNTYLLSYNTQGGSTAPSNATIGFGTTATVDSTPPTRTGFTFAGWNNAGGTGTMYLPGATFTMPDSNVTLFAQWTKTAFTLVYNTNGGQGNYTSQPVKFNESITLDPTSPTRTGYTFAGWNSEPNGNGTNYSAGQSFTLATDSNITLYAKWTARSYTVTYDANSGSGAPAGGTHVFDSQVTSSTGSSLVKSGFRFIGWNTQADGTGTSFVAGSAFKMPALNVDLYAQWIDNSFEIAYNSNGGSGGPDAVDVLGDLTYTIDVNRPVRPGFNFDGWKLADGTPTNALLAPGTDSFTISGNELLVAEWSKKTINVTYDLNSGTGTVPSAQSGLYDADISLASTSGVSREFFKFVGWSTTPDGSGPTYAAGGSYTLPTTDVTLYAKWAPINFVINYNAAGGSGEPANQFAPPSATVLLASQEPQKPGHVFESWTDVAQNSTYDPGSALVMPSSNVTLIANYRVSTGGGGGGGGAPAPAVSPTPTPTPTRGNVPSRPNPGNNSARPQLPAVTPTPAPTSQNVAKAPTRSDPQAAPPLATPPMLPGFVVRPPAASTGTLSGPLPQNLERATVDTGSGIESAIEAQRSGGDLGAASRQSGTRTVEELASEKLTGFAPGAGLRVEILGARTGARFVLADLEVIDAVALIRAMEASITTQEANFSKITRVVRGERPLIQEAWAPEVREGIEEFFEAVGLEAPRALIDLDLNDVKNWVSIEAEVETYQPGSTVFLVATSSPIVLATAKVDRFGKAELAGVMPVEALGTGEHRVRVVGIRSLEGVSVDSQGEIQLSADLMDEIQRFDLGTQSTIALSGLNPEGGFHSAIRVVPLIPVAPWWTLWFILAGFVLAIGSRYRRLLDTSTRRAIAASGVVASALPAVIIGWVSTVTNVVWVGILLGLVGAVLSWFMPEQKKRARRK